MKNKLHILLLLLFGLMLFTACQPAEVTEEQTEDDDTPTGETITIGTLPAEGSLPIILALEKGFFKAHGVNIEIKTFTSPNDRNVALQAGELDGAIGDVMTTAAFVDRGIALKVTSDINEDFKILSSPDSGITSMSQLADKDISLVPNFILEYIMDVFAAEEDFQYNIIEIPSFAGRAEALLENQIDGVVFTEPQAGLLVQQGAHMLGSSKEAGIKGGTIFFTEESIMNYPADLKAFYTAYNEAVDYMNETDASEYSDILTAYQFPDAMSIYLNNKPDPYEHAGSIDEGQFKEIIEWTTSKGQINKTYAYDDLTDFSFIEQ
ncbi:hypothetical protein GCM10012290_00640 [Halolactibacillus alkaliphilus]|uniref:Solute-binding protein family 3/N-terminal domain-containing protein n=1 Tax=Halolactibacillus alkaliphilus TaxID=442899 RepID=A0A511WYL2_9BACI|nr:ABC transporter substrate-binding protein [Halolactibacillus alkaliphilus]GEN55611.1 hypothetical protein HAL01_00750 [Halolactibacillus alkaliphilus]GGN63765.1 hypothetical protein GCM10012290_00640 [Halolactibacillus alkaliphilus]SFO62489.1 NitT/TauT family transport system substrate-binding protein [Halolactibacillus alkaliphilus]